MVDQQRINNSKNEEDVKALSFVKGQSPETSGGHHQRDNLGLSLHLNAVHARNQTAMPAQRTRDGNSMQHYHRRNGNGMKATNLGKIDGGGVNISQTISDTKGIPKESLGNSFFNARVTKFQTIKVGEASIESFSNKNDQRGKTALCNIRKPNGSDV